MVGLVIFLLLLTLTLVTVAGLDLPVRQRWVDDVRTLSGSLQDVAEGINSATPAVAVAWNATGPTEEVVADTNLTVLAYTSNNVSVVTSAAAVYRSTVDFTQANAVTR